MPAAARVDDPITHSQSHSEATKQMWEGIGTGILIGVAIIGLTVLTGGGDLVVAGAALAAGGTVLSLGGKGFLQGAKQGQQHVERHGEVKTGSGNVTINKHAAAAACLSAIDCDEHSGSQKLAQGSRTVTINGKMASRVGDKSTCDGVIAAGSGNVTIGGATGQCAAISQEVADWETGLAHDAVVVGTVAQIVGMVLTGVGAVRAVMLAPAALRTMMMVRMGAGLTSGVLFGSGVSYYGGQKYGQGSWQQEAMGTSAGLLGGMMGDAAASSGPRIIGGIKSGFADAFEPGGLFGGPELAPAGGPGGFGGGVDPEIVPRAPGSPGMDAWNPPANDPMQMSSTGESSGGSRTSGGNSGNNAPSTGRYGDLKSQLPDNEQANHLNQNAAFKRDNGGNTFIPENDGAAVGMEGNAFTEPGTPHYEFHRSLEGFWSQYRSGGSLEGEVPTNAEYDQALRSALQSSGLDDQQVNALADYANQNRLTYNLGPTDSVPRVPGILRQRPPAPSNP